MASAFGYQVIGVSKDSVKSHEKFFSIKTKLAKEGGFPINILTDSMEPVIRPGENVDVKLSDLDSLNVFDIVIYWDEGLKILVCHYFVGFTKVINKKRKYLVCKGIKSKNKDFIISPDCFLGVVDKKLPFLTRVREVVKHRRL